MFFSITIEVLLFIKKRTILLDTGVTTVSLHPGVVDTELPRHLGTAVFPGASWAYSKLGWWLMKTPWQGAQTSLHCALDESIQSGLYYE